MPQLQVATHAEAAQSAPKISRSAEYASDIDPTPRTANLAAGLAVPTDYTLPPLPLVPKSATSFFLLAYLFRVAQSRWQRRRIATETQRSLRKDGKKLDRLLTDLGQHAYIEQVDLLPLYAPPVPRSGGAWTTAEAVAQAESWAARIDAEQWRMLAVLTREEARLTSDLLRWVDTQRQDQSLSAEPALQDEFELLLGRLAAVRVERWVQERARKLCHEHSEQLQRTLAGILLSQKAHPEAREIPNLLLLGSLLACQRSLASARAVEPWFTTIPGRPTGVELPPALFATLWRFQDSLLPRVVLCARASVERLAYDTVLLRRGLLCVAMLGFTGMLCMLIIAWALALF